VVETLGAPLEELLRFPKYVDIETVNQCNARCTMCGVDFRRRGRTRFMSDAVFAAILTQLAAHARQVERVGLAVNCEPLLDAGLERRIRAVKDAGIAKAFVSTNAELLTPRRGRALLEAGVDVIYLSIDSLRKECFESIRRGLSFEHVYRNAMDFVRLKRALKPAVVLRVCMVVQEQNRDEVEAFVEHWAGVMGPNDEVVVNRAYRWGTASHLAPLRPDGAAPPPCISLWSTMIVNTSGEMVLCCCDANSGHVLGHIGRDSLEQVWQGPELTRLRDRHLRGQRAGLRLCPHCEAWSPERQILKRRFGST
jgi:wyosine [tRNA(Phe)-imidazoG37] synthetase (radical SAM superfamily)